MIYGNKIKMALKCGASFSTAIAALCIPHMALAQQASASDEAQPPADIVVTGSFLRSRNNDANPVQTVTSEAIAKTSATNIGDYLQRLPSIGSTASNNTRANSGAGLNCADIRNLGQSRVLVLVDGKRQVQTMAPGLMCVDLNQIPVGQIASVEILKDGGSELYGADAVSGVINLKLRHDIDDGNLTFRSGVTSRGDNGTLMVSGYKGFNFDEGRGNITVFGQYRAQEGIYQRDRSFSRLASSNNPAPGGSYVYGSGLTDRTRVDTSGLNLISNNDGTFSRYTTADNYNYGKDQMITGRTRDLSLSFDAHYDLSDAATFYANGSYAHRTFHNNSGGVGVQGSGVTTSTLPSTLILPANNPYNIWGRDVNMYKRFADLGDHPLDNTVNSFQGMAGFKGKILGDWNYDASVTYATSKSKLVTGNNVNYRHLLQELDVRQVNPASSSSPVVYDPTVCTSQAGCVLVNPFLPWSGAAADYIAIDTTDRSKYEMVDLNLRVNNDRLFSMPYAGAGDVGIAFGVEHRWEHGRYTPDSRVVSGDVAGISTAATSGGFSVTEAYGELRVPFLENVAFARDLSVDVQGRWSHYTTSGSTENWKVGANWAPVRDIRFRGTYGTSYRQPSIFELYGGSTLSLVSAIDPCAQAATYGASAATVAATCANNGVNTATFTSAYSGQLPTLSGGNSDLRPESGRTFTLGTVLTPHWIPNLSFSAEYWNYKISNTIGTLPTQYILDQCYTGANTSYCGYVSPRSSSGQLTQISARYQNLGTVKARGMDFDLKYSIDLSDSDRITLDNTLQWQMSYRQQNRPNGPWLDYTGDVLYSSGFGYPDVKDYATVTWTHNNFGITYMLNYTSSLDYNNGTRELTATTNQYYKTGSVVSHDIQVELNLDPIKFQAGVTNLFDRQPPYIPTGVFNTAGGLYGAQMVGRYMWIQAGVNF